MKISRAIGSVAVLLLAGTLAQAAEQHEEAKQPEKQGRAAQPQAHPTPQPERRAPQAAPRQERAQQPAAPRPAPQQARQEQQRSEQPRQPERQAVQKQPERAQPQQARQSTFPTRKEQPVAARQQQPQRTQQQAQSWQQQRGWQKPGGPQGHATFSQDRAQNWTADHRTWGQRGGYGGAYIPQATFGVSFGSRHFFRLGAQPVMFEGYPRFAYGGYSFLLVDPWPSDWSANWYASDDVYIDYDDGYYLVDRRFPQQRLAVTVVL